MVPNRLDFAFPDDTREEVVVVIMERVDFREVLERLDFPDVAECASSSRLVADPCYLEVQYNEQ